MRLRSVTRPAQLRKAIVGLSVAFISVPLLPAALALADTVTTDFEGFSACSPPQPVFVASCTVDGQDGWTSARPGQVGPSLPNGYDQQVVGNASLPGAPAPADFGSKSLRLSNAYGTGVDTYPPEYEKQTYSKPAKEPAGQDLPNTEFTGQFSFISIHPDQYQPRLNVTVSPDNGHGGRMSYIGLVDTADGKIAITFYDTDPDGDWVSYDLGTVPRNVSHTIKFWMRLIPGPNNDLVRISIDGQDAGQCFTTWESSNKVVPISDRLLFLSGNRDGNRLGLLGGGYLFDNVSVTTGGDGPPGCDLPIEKKADSQTVRAGGLAGYGITVRNRGHVAARNLRVCDQIPRRMTFVSATREMSRDGRRRCFVISLLKPGQRASVHLMLRVNTNAPAGTVDNTVDITPVPPTDRPSLPGLPGLPVPPPGPFPPGALPLVIEALPPGAVLAAIPPIAKAKARVKVVARLTPRVTG